MRRAHCSRSDRQLGLGGGIEPAATLGRVSGSSRRGSLARRLPDALRQDRSAVTGEAVQASRATGHRQQQ
jgi:hypothetical protein